MAVCGQAPVSTAMTRSGAISPLRLMRSASSFVTRSLVTTAMLVPRLMKRGMSCSSSAVLPEPTGPPTPTRAAPGWDLLVCGARPSVNMDADSLIREQARSLILVAHRRHVRRRRVDEGLRDIGHRFGEQLSQEPASGGEDALRIDVGDDAQPQGRAH